MNFTSKYMLFWVSVVTVAFVIDAFGLLQRVELDSKSFMIGAVVGFLLFKVAPKVRKNDE